MSNQSTTRLAAETLAVQAVMRWRRGESFELRADFGPYRPRLYELLLCGAQFAGQEAAVRAPYHEEVWSWVRAWPRFHALADAVEAYEERVRHATTV